MHNPEHYANHTITRVWVTGERLWIDKKQWTFCTCQTLFYLCTHTFSGEQLDVPGPLPGGLRPLSASLPRHVVKDLKSLYQYVDVTSQIGVPLVFLIFVIMYFTTMCLSIGAAIWFQSFFCEVEAVGFRARWPPALADLSPPLASLSLFMKRCSRLLLSVLALELSILE